MKYKYQKGRQRQFGGGKSRDSTSTAERATATAVLIAAQEITGTLRDAGKSRVSRTGGMLIGNTTTRDASNSRDVKNACNCTVH